MLLHLFDEARPCEARETKELEEVKPMDGLVECSEFQEVVQESEAIHPNIQQGILLNSLDVVLLDDLEVDLLLLLKVSFELLSDRLCEGLIPVVHKQVCHCLYRELKLLKGIKPPVGVGIFPHC